MASLAGFESHDLSLRRAAPLKITSAKQPHFQTLLLVVEAGFESARPKPHAPKACASTIPPLPRFFNGVLGVHSSDYSWMFDICQGSSDLRTAAEPWGRSATSGVCLGWIFGPSHAHSATGATCPAVSDHDQDWGRPVSPETRHPGFNRLRQTALAISIDDSPHAESRRLSNLAPESDFSTFCACAQSASALPE